jgi:hypothetical protein
LSAATGLSIHALGRCHAERNIVIFFHFSFNVW